MQIIVGKENAEKLREKYTVLDLETLEVEGKLVDVYCVIPGDKLSLPDLPQLENWVKLHNEFLEGYKKKNYNYCRQATEHLMGKFGGEVDTFYEEILKRIDSAEAQKSN